MRIPLLRSGKDETPIAWWEWLFAPLMMPLFALVLLVMGVLSVPAEFAYRVRQRRQEGRLRPRLVAADRYIDWAEVEVKLKAGEGTLIVEHRTPQGPIREWWTDDDLISASPVPLPASTRVPPEEGQSRAVQDYARTCSARYTDAESGAAQRTEVPVPLDKRLDPRKYVVVDLGGGLMTAIMLPTGRKLAEKYHRGKVVTLVEWFDEPLLFVGDAESVFLADDAPDGAGGAGG